MMTAPIQGEVWPRGSYTHQPLFRLNGKGRFYQCPICGGWVDGADVQQVIEHEGKPVAAQPDHGGPLAEAS